MAKYRKLPVVIEAMQFTDETKQDCFNFVTCEKYADHEQENSAINWDKKLLVICTLEGRMTASLGDYIIKGVNGEFYPCKPDIFEKTYELVE
jgi:hypothetical protein